MRHRLDRLALALFSPALLLTHAIGCHHGRVPVDQVHHAAVAEDLERVAAAVAEVRRVGHQKPLGVDPLRLDVVGARELVLVFPGKSAAEAHNTRGNFAPVM